MAGCLVEWNVAPHPKIAKSDILRQRTLSRSLSETHTRPDKASGQEQERFGSAAAEPVQFKDSKDIQGMSVHVCLCVRERDGERETSE